MKTSLFVIAAALTIVALIQSPSAQPNNDKMAMEELAGQTKSSPAEAAAAHWKADDAMGKALLLLPTEDVKKAIAAMPKIHDK
jgi:hypothetical protein